MAPPTDFPSGRGNASGVGALRGLGERVARARPKAASALRQVADRVAHPTSEPGQTPQAGRPDVEDQPASDAEAGPGSPLATEDDLRACYRLLLGRDPDPGGWQGYLPYIHVRPTPVDELVGFFLSSMEFRKRLATTFSWSEGAPVPVDLRAGYRIWLRPNDPIMEVVRQDRAYEPHVVERMTPLLQPNSVMIDVGASFGFYTVLAARSVGPGGRVIACEPGPQNQSVLLFNLIAGGLDNVELRLVAASDQPGALLYSRSGANGAVSVFEGDPASLATNDLVECQPLDSIVGPRERVDVIKIDVEGAEGRVLAGAKGIVDEHHPALFLEFSPPSIEAVSGVTGSGLLESLEGRGYVFEVLGAGAGGVMSPAEVVARYHQVGHDHLDVLAVVPG